MLTEITSNIDTAIGNLSTSQGSDFDLLKAKTSNSKKRNSNMADEN